jgi:hypothetical protein
LPRRIFKRPRHIFRQLDDAIGQLRDPREPLRQQRFRLLAGLAQPALRLGVRLAAPLRCVVVRVAPHGSRHALCGGH